METIQCTADECILGNHFPLQGLNQGFYHITRVKVHNLLLFSDQQLLTKNHTKGLNQLNAKDFTSAKLVWMVLEEMIVLYVRIFLSTFRERTATDHYCKLNTETLFLS